MAPASHKRGKLPARLAGTEMITYTHSYDPSEHTLQTGTCRSHSSVGTVGIV